MRDTELQRLEHLVEELLDLDADRRAERLELLRARGEIGIGLLARLVARHERPTAELATPPDEGRLPPGFQPHVDPLLGRQLGDFTLLTLVGIGATGRVYEARQQAPERRVAVKVLAAHAFAGAVEQARFRREGNLLAALDHPAICRIYAAGAAPLGAGVVPFLAMEYVDGRPLDVAGRRLALAPRLELFARVVDAVQFAHSRGVVHRDLKPANILVIADEASGPPRPKVLDFGIARLLATDGRAAPPTVTVDFARVVGTPGYSSPEQLVGGDVDPRSDVYALGVILFELLTGVVPFPAARTLAEAARAVAGSPAPLLRTAAPRLDRDLEAIVARALEAEPQRRYATAAELAADVRRFLAGERVLARRATIAYRLARWARRRRHRLAVMVVIVVLAITATVALLAMSAGHRQQRWQRYVSTVQESVAGILANDPAGALARLDDAPPDLRGFEWRYVAVWANELLQRLPNDPPDAERLRRGKRIHLADLQLHDPHVDLANWQAAEKTFELFDLRDQAVYARIRDLPHAPWRFAVTPTRSHVVFTGMPEHAIEVWDLATSTRTARLDGFNGEDNFAVLTPDGGSVAVAGDSGIVRLFDLPAIKPGRVLQVPGRVGGIAFAPEGTRVAITWDAGLAVFSLRDGARLCTVDTRGDQPIYVTFDDAGTKLLGLNYRASNLNLWDAATGTLLRRQAFPEGTMSMLRIPGAARVAVGTSHGAVRIFATDEVEDGPWQPLLTLRETVSAIGAMTVARDGTALLAVPWDRQLLLWQVPVNVPRR